jgi:hypothetical protein
MLTEVSDISWVRTLSDLGTVGVMIAVIFGGFKRVWIWGYHYDDLRRSSELEQQRLREDRDRWQDIALRSLNVSEAVVHRNSEV